MQLYSVNALVMLGIEMRNLVIRRLNGYGEDPGVHRINEKIHRGDDDIGSRGQDDPDKAAGASAEFNRN